MHDSQREHISRRINTYLEKDRHYRVVDVGSAKSKPEHLTHRDLFEGYDHEYLGVDIRHAENVNVVMRKPYRIPVATGSADVVVCGSAFEHIPFFWVTFLEICRIAAPDGWIFLTAPSRGNPHGAVDCWRFYPDAMRSLAAFARMVLVETHTDFPPLRPGRRRFDYAAIDAEQYWGDTVGVFRKPQRYSHLVGVAREVSVWWANRVGGLGGAPRAPRRGRPVAAGS